MKISDLKSQDLLRIKAFKLDGRTISETAQVFKMTESDMSALYEAIDGSGGTPAAPTRTLAEAVRERQIHEEAETMVQRANSAEERGLEKASLQELAAVAALTVPR